MKAKGTTVRVPGGGPATIAAGAAHDAFGNTNAEPLEIP